MSDYQPENQSFLPAIPETPPDPMEQGEERSYQQTVRGRFVMLPIALGLIGLGVLLLAESQIEGFDVTLPIAILLLLATFALANLFRFFVSGRRERGAFFLALSMLSMGVVLAAMSLSSGSIDSDLAVSLVLAGLAISLYLTYLLERQREQGLQFAAILIFVAAGVSFLVAQEVISRDIVNTIADYWTLLIAFVGVTLVPLAMRRSMDE